MLADKLTELRKRRKMSQEKLAEKLNVSRQAVQKWESGLSLPDTDRIVGIARFFDVSIDWLLSMPDHSTTEELRLRRNFIPRYQKMKAWEVFSSDLMVEYWQGMDEGRDVENLFDLFQAVAALPVGHHREQLSDTLFSMVQSAPMRSDYAYVEPNELEAIQAERHITADIRREISLDKYREKVRGAWYGRVCGCMLGATVECISMDELHTFLRRTDNFPLHRYILSSDVTEESTADMKFNLRSQKFVDRISGFFDDDINYTILASAMVESVGRAFTSSDIWDCWRKHLPYNAVCTAERVAYRNMLNGYLPPDSAEYKNPYREWIGASIRADYYGYINPGDAETAAEMAYMDSSISHVKNGVYGSMFVAAALATAAVCSDMRTVIEAGLSQIPHACRLYEALRGVIAMHDNGADYDTMIQSIHERFDEHLSHGWTHIIPNLCITITALLCGQNDFARTICMAVQAGFDTDCNGATAGSIVGMILSSRGIPEEWIGPLKGRLIAQLSEVPSTELDELVELTLTHCLSEETYL